MSETTVLVIDDSATIRRLVDTHLSQAGYHVALAPNAEEGLQLTEQLRPDLILLDHQLPGTTGFQVCEQLLQSPDLRQIPIVVSSTLRKKAYAEYTDVPNVVDMLPKPFAPELLLTTVSNVLETGQLVVESQSSGTAVPEVIQELQEVTLSGSLTTFRLREVIDFLNNGQKTGLLEIETERNRVSFYLDGGRIQAVTATGINAQDIVDGLPEALSDLAPVVNFTVGGRFASEVDGLVQLLDKKVIDHRLLRKLLRHQAAVLTHRCFTARPSADSGHNDNEPPEGDGGTTAPVETVLKSFRFEANAPVPPLFQKLRLEISLAALLVDGALSCKQPELPPPQTKPDGGAQTMYVRSAVRGQNLDRAGLAAGHMKILSQLSEPMSSQDIATRLGLNHDEVRRVLYGLTLAELVECRKQTAAKTVFALEQDPNGGQVLRSLLSDGSRGFAGRVVRDQLGLQLLVKRSVPDAILMAIDNEELRRLAEKVDQSARNQFEHVRWVAILPQTHGTTNNGGDEPNEDKTDTVPSLFAAVLRRPYTQEHVLEVLNSLCHPDGAANTIATENADTTSEPSEQLAAASS